MLNELLLAIIKYIVYKKGTAYSLSLGGESSLTRVKEDKNCHMKKHYLWKLFKQHTLYMNWLENVSAAVILQYRYKQQFSRSCMLLWIIQQQFWKVVLFFSFHVTTRLFDISRDKRIWKCGNISLECQKLTKKKKINNDLLLGGFHHLMWFSERSYKD